MYRWNLWFSFENQWFFKDDRANLWISFEKLMNFSPGCVMQVCVADGFKSLQMTTWTQLAPKMHLRVKVMYWKCHFLSALHFPEIRGSRFETSCEFGRKKSFEHENGVLDLRVLPFHFRKTEIMWFCWISEFSLVTGLTRIRGNAGC